MKKQVLIPAIVLIHANTLAIGRLDPGQIKYKQNAGISFTENKGQVHDQNYNPRTDVLYGAMTGNMAVHIKKSGVSYQLLRADKYKEVADPKTKVKRQEIDQQTIFRIDLNWLNHNPNFTVTEDEVLNGYSNYYLENCPDGALNVKSFKGVTLKNLYCGINLHYYEKEGELKHDYIVAPHADYKQIQLRVEGAEISINKDGSLLLSTPFGKVQEASPIVFQNGKQINARWEVSKNVLRFDLENYNPGYELIIDPVTRIWGTYYGDSDYNEGLSCATDASGNVYLAGYTDSFNTSTLIATQGSHQSTFGGANDAFLVKFNGSGVRQWATYYGGAGGEQGQSCTVDVSGNIYLAGQTSSGTGNFMATSGSHQSSFGGGFDAYLVKFNSNGLRLWGTYYGGSDFDFGKSCCTDASGNVYLAGYGRSISGIATTGSHQQSLSGNIDNAFLVKFNSNGVRQWGTYYGGSQGAVGFSCASDAAGNVYLAGYTYSNTGIAIATPGSHQSTGGGWYDAFLVKFNSSGTRQWATYYGGAADDYGFSCATDASGNVYLSGQTASNTGTVISTLGSHQSTYGGGNSDAFLVKFNSNGTRQWGTYYGGTTGYEAANYCVTDASGNVYITGMTESGGSNIIATAGSHQTAFGGGSIYDGFLTKFNSVGTRQWGTYYGGTSYDYSYSCAIDPIGNQYMAGWTGTNTGTVIATPGSHQAAFGGSAEDAFLVKFDGCDVAPSPPGAINSLSVCAGITTTFSTPAAFGALSYTWSLPGGWSGSSNTNTITATPGASGIFTLVAGNACGVSPQQTLNVIVNLPPTVTVSSGTICSGQSFTLAASGASTYSYSTGPIISPTTTSAYSVTGTSAAGCVSSNTAVSVVSVNPLPAVNVTTTHSLLCAGDQATLLASGAANYSFDPGGAGPNVFVSPTITTTYTVTGTDANGCSNTAVITQTVDACASIKNEGLGINNSAIRIYPNPTKGIISLGLASESEIVINNALGQIVYASQLSSGKHQINLEKWSKGIYIVRVTHFSNPIHFKLVKE